MTDEIYVYLVNLPPGINEAVMPCAGGYTVYINSALTFEGRVNAYKHALWHINNRDFEKFDVQEIECDAHERRKCM